MADPGAGVLQHPRRLTQKGHMMLAAGKIMLLTLIAVFSNGEMDADSFIGDITIDQCKEEGILHANEWRAHDPRIVAVSFECTEKDDPRPFLYMQRPELMPAPDAEPLPREHVPGKDEA